MSKKLKSNNKMKKLNYLKINSILFGATALALLFSCNPKKAYISSEKSEQTATTQTEKSPDPAHNSKNSLDWNGVYQGDLPCDECSNELKATLTLEEHGAFELETEYPDKNEKKQTKQEHFKWNKAGSAITLQDENQEEI